MDSAPPLLEVKDLHAGYGRAEVLTGLNFELARGQAGTLRAMLRLDRAEERHLFAEAERQLARIGMADRMHELAGNLALGPQRLMEIARAAVPSGRSAWSICRRHWGRSP